ncbi:unnamed protein product [Linum trigynum]|uniref:Uncharacterized protein n=1 Tax=Linum trigynum TaxID=586398 RepID=A0AAV2GVA7_9ROSI
MSLRSHRRYRFLDPPNSVPYFQRWPSKSLLSIASLSCLLCLRQALLSFGLQPTDRIDDWGLTVEAESSLGFNRSRRRQSDLTTATFRSRRQNQLSRGSPPPITGRRDDKEEFDAYE